MRNRGFTVWAAAFLLAGWCIVTQGAPPRKQTTAYYLVLRCDGSSEVREMTRTDAQKLQKEERTAFANLRRQWMAERNVWREAATGKSFPVAAPQPGQVRLLGSVPTKPDARAKALQQHKRRLDLWDVCVITGAEGERSVEALHRRKIALRKRELQTAYAKAFLEWFGTPKDDLDEETPKAPPKAATLFVARRGFTSRDAARKHAEKLSQATPRNRRSVEKK